MERAVGRQAFIQEKKLVQECCNPEINYYNPFQINFLNGDDWEESTVTLTFGCTGYIEFALVDIATANVISSSIVFRFNSPTNTFTYSIPQAISTQRYILLLWLEPDSSPLTDVTVFGTTVNRVTSFGNYSPGVYGSLDVSQCPNLRFLDIAGSINLTSVNLGSPKTFLNAVYASGSGITSLDVSGSTSLSLLEVLNCSSLETLTLTGCTSLEELNAYSNPLLSTIDVSGCSSLTKLYAYDCSALETLTLTGCTSLEELYAHTNPLLSAIDVSGFSSLTLLNAYTCPTLGSLILTGCSSLTTLNAYNCPALETLTLTGCTSLQVLDILNTRVPAINVSGFTQLTTLNTQDNPDIVSIDASGCILLSQLLAFNCTSLQSVNAPNCTSLTNLDCFGSSSLSTVNVANCNAGAILNLINCGFTTANVDLGFASYLIAGPNPATGTINLEGQGIVINSCPDLLTLDDIYGWTITGVII